MTSPTSRVASFAERLMPAVLKQKLAAWAESVGMLGEIRDPKVAGSLVPSAVRGLFLKRGKQGVPTPMGPGAMPAPPGGVPIQPV